MKISEINQLIKSFCHVPKQTLLAFHYLKLHQFCISVFDLPCVISVFLCKDVFSQIRLEATSGQLCTTFLELSKVRFFFKSARTKKQVGLVALVEVSEAGPGLTSDAINSYHSDLRGSFLTSLASVYSSVKGE